MPAYKDKNGTWQARFYYDTFDGKRKQAKKRGFATKKEALQYEHDFLTADRLDENMSFAQASAIFLEDKENRLKPTTWRQYENTLDTVILPLWGNIPVAEINHRDVVSLQNKLLSMGLKPSTVGKYEATTKTIYKYVAKLCNIKNNPFEDVANVGKQPRKSLQFWTLEQYNGFRDSLKDIRELATFDALFYTGMRIGELKALRCCDIDFENKIIHVTATYNTHHGKEEIHTPKTETSVRNIANPQFLLDEILEYKNKLYGATDETRIFSFISQQHLRDIVRRYCGKHKNVPYIKIHSFRHSHVALLIDKGIDIMTISERLGHTTPTITMNIYGHLYPNKHGKVATMIENLYSD